MNKRVSKVFGILFLLVELLIVPKAIDLMVAQHLSSLPVMRIIALSMTFGSIVLCILMAFSILSDSDGYPLHTFLFSLAVFLCCIAPMTEMFTKALDEAGKPGLNMLVNTVYYLVGINIAYIIMLYEFLIIGAERKPALRRRRRAASVLMLIDNLATLLNVRFGYFFTISESGVYQSAPTYWVAFIAPVLIIVLIVYTAAREIRPGRKRNAFLYFWVFTLIASALQAWQGALSVQYTGYTLTLIVIYLNVQSELDTSGTHSLKRGAA